LALPLHRLLTILLLVAVAQEAQQQVNIIQMAVVGLEDLELQLDFL